MLQQIQHDELFLLNDSFSQDSGSMNTLPVRDKETEPRIKAYQFKAGRFFFSKPDMQIHYRIPEVRARWRYPNMHTSSLKKVSLLADEQKHDLKER